MNFPSFMDHLRVVLVATRNPLNIGAAARAMSNFGCTHLRLVNPYDPAYREAVSAVGAAPVLANAEQFPTVAEAVADCTLVVGTTAAGRRELIISSAPSKPPRPLFCGTSRASTLRAPKKIASRSSS